MKKFVSNILPDIEFKEAVKKPIKVRCAQINEPFEVDTLEGKMIGQKGDWLMVGVNGELYPCADEIFKKTYILNE